jgi:uncharacterized protein
VRPLPRDGHGLRRHTADGDLRPADEDEEVSDDDDVVGFAGNEIDLSDEVRDEILLAMPLKPLCKDDCQGLCPVCGGNRNTVPCTCEADRRQAASQFAALGKLKI